MARFGITLYTIMYLGKKTFLFYGGGGGNVQILGRWYLHGGSWRGGGMCKDKADTQYTIYATKKSLKNDELSNNVPFTFKCFHNPTRPLVVHT